MWGCGAVGGALALTLLIGGWQGAVAGTVLGVLLWYRLGRLEPMRVRRERDRVESDLPFAVDLLASALRAGLPLERAVQVVADEIEGPIRVRLRQVADSMALGLPTGQAWGAFADVPVGRRLAVAIERSSASGAALAGALFRLAEDLRAARTTEADAAGRRAGVLIVLPLGLCFLPAFVFAGIVPVIIAVLGDALRP